MLEWHGQFDPNDGKFNIHLPYRLNVGALTRILRAPNSFCLFYEVVPLWLGGASTCRRSLTESIIGPFAIY